MHSSRQVSSFTLLPTGANQAGHADAAIPKVSILNPRPAPAAPPLGRKPEFTRPTDLLDLERRRISAKPN